MVVIKSYNFVIKEVLESIYDKYPLITLTSFAFDYVIIKLLRIAFEHVKS